MLASTRLSLTKTTRLAALGSIACLGVGSVVGGCSETLASVTENGNGGVGAVGGAISSSGVGGTSASSSGKRQSGGATPTTGQVGVHSSDPTAAGGVSSSGSGSEGTVGTTATGQGGTSDEPADSSSATMGGSGVRGGRGDEGGASTGGTTDEPVGSGSATMGGSSARGGRGDEGGASTGGVASGGANATRGSNIKGSSLNGGAAASVATGGRAAGTATGGRAAGGAATGASTSMGGTAAGGTTVTGTSTGTHTGKWRIMPVGDSITATTCYPNLTAKNLTSTGHTNFQFVGSVLNNQSCNGAPNVQTEGHGGKLVTQMTSQFATWANDGKADIAFVHFATNDLWNNVAPAEILTAYTSLVDALRAAVPSVVVFVAQIVPLAPSDCAQCPPRVERFNQQIPSWASGKSTPTSPIYVVDLWTGMTMSSDSADGVHPNVTGAQKMADKMSVAIVAKNLPNF